MLDRKTSMWDNIMKKHGTKGIEEDSDWDEDDAMPAESQFEDATILASKADTTIVACTEDPMDYSPEGALLVQMIEASVSTESQDVVQIHAGEDDFK